MERKIDTNFRERNIYVVPTTREWQTKKCWSIILFLISSYGRTSFIMLRVVFAWKMRNPKEWPTSGLQPLQPFSLVVCSRKVTYHEEWFGINSRTSFLLLFFNSRGMLVLRRPFFPKLWPWSPFVRASNGEIGGDSVFLHFLFVLGAQIWDQTSWFLQFVRFDQNPTHCFPPWLWIVNIIAATLLSKDAERWRLTLLLVFKILVSWFLNLPNKEKRNCAFYYL